MKTKQLKTFIWKHFMVLFLLCVFSVSTISFFLESNPLVNALPTIEEDILSFDGTYDWETTLDVKTSTSDYITYADFRDTYCTWSDSASTCASAANNKYIRFDTAEELYRFSMDVSFEQIYVTGDPVEDQKLPDDKIAVLLSLDYVLGKDIDYSIMQSKAFIPIGYAFTDVEENVYERSFTGTFDGQGFEIRNLYVAGYDYLIYVDEVDEVTTIDIALSEHYSMFNYNEGTIKNLGLTNANLEILELHIDIIKLSNLVGFNMTNEYTASDVSFTNSTSTIASTSIDLSVYSPGDKVIVEGSTSNDNGTNEYYTVVSSTANTLVVEESLTDESAGASISLFKPGVVENVYVLDSRASLQAGMRYQVGTASEDFEAAGIVHTNQGVFIDSYYVSPLVMNASYINKFEVQPLVFYNAGVIDTLVYDFDTYLTQVSVGGSTVSITPVNSSLVTAETTALIKSDSSSLNASGSWYFYPSDGYPLLLGFDYYSESSEIYYEIDNAVDFVFFAEVIQFSTVANIANAVAYSASNYVLTDDIDLSMLAPDAYVIPEDTFTGTLSGYNDSGTDLSDNYYIYNLNIDEDILKGSGYYAGMFSVLGAGSEISNLNFSQSSVSFTDTDENYSSTFYIGAIAGRMIGGTISNVLLDVDIDLGTEALGVTYAGSVVGKASGIIEYVSNYGDIDGNDHVFNAAYSIAPIYNIGGIVGAADGAALAMTDTVNHGPITGIGTASDISLATGYTQAKIRIGGVVGYLYNTLGNVHGMVNVSNFADITTSAFESDATPAYAYIGGIFGKLEGIDPILEADSTYKFANFYNEGDIIHTYQANTATIKAAGIGVNNASEAIEYALLFNNGTFDFTKGAATYTQTQFKYVNLIYDIGSSPVTLSRSYNYADLTFDNNVFTEINGVYVSDNDVATTLQFVANYGDIYYLNNSGNTQISLGADTVIAGITTSENIDYLNVYNYGDIDFVNINVGTYDVYIAGITTQLDTEQFMKNSINDGDIIFAEISGSGNLYIAGLVNTNYAGDLQDAGQSTTQPTATEGIINSINSGNISTSFGAEVDGLYGIHGTSNTFMAGLVTLNKGSIQNGANLGNVKGYNSNASSSFSFESSTYFAGLVNGYNSGIVAGGVVATVIGGDSRIYDTANNGNVIAVTYKYVRAGGVLGVSLYEEADAGGITSGMGLSDDIEDSVLSNGMNLGNISAISNTISTYSTSSTNTGTTSIYENSPYISGVSIPSVTTTVGNSARPTIYSSAGGVIGYGLSYMQRMLNHGNISSTDVAGGVVGATYVLGGSSSTTTVVNITTAINYGDIDAVDNSDFSLINKYELSYSDVSSNFMSTNDFDDFVYPGNYSPEFPGGKRGFGGIFGRLQRGLNGVMTNEGGAFDFIVNANENIDLIGRLDQVNNFSSSSRYFRFNDAIYYSAKLNDTTQVVFTGFRLGYSGSGTITAVNGTTVYADYDGYIMYQVGIVNEYQYESPTVYEGYYYDSYPGSVGQSSDAGYIGPIEVPWITEDPLDPNLTDADTEYMYDPDFPMRTNPDLTEYIYYMPNELLADRFNTERPDGMYVLSTSAGQSFGSVIPKNIDISLIRMIDEHSDQTISLLTDYNNISAAQREPLASVSVGDETGHTDLGFTNATSTISSTTFDLSVFEDGDKIIVFGSDSNDGIYTVNGTPTSTSLVVDEVLSDEVAGASIVLLKSTIESSFYNLNQTTFNDKAELIPSDSIIVTLTEDNGSSTVLANPTVDYVNKEITYSISMEAFNPSQTSVSYAVTNALTSTGALIAMRPDDYYGYAPNASELQAYRALLYAEKDNGIATGSSIAAELSVATLPAQSITSNVTLSAGYFTVFSEAFVGDNLYATSTYYNNYEVIIVFTPTSDNLPGTTEIENVSFNGGGNVAVSSPVADVYDLRTLGDVNSLGSITLYFVDGKGLFSQGYDFKDNFVIKYNDGTEVSSAYYSVTSTPVDGSGNYDITFTFTGVTISGDYYFEFSYFPTSTLFTCHFDKAASNDKEILDFTYYSEQDSLSIVGTTITSYINVGWFPTGMDASSPFDDYTENVGSGVSYLSNTTYDIDFMVPGSLELSPFASVTEARIVTETFTNGYKTYVMNYTIEAEDGTTSIYTHNLIERTVDLTAVLKNGNDVPLNDVFTSREAVSTDFTIDLGLDQTLDLYAVETGSYDGIEVSVSGTTNDGLTTYTPGEIVGLTYTADDYLHIIMSYETLPGIYTFSFVYYREGSSTDYITFATSLEITKNLGTDAYLSDIVFSEFATETTYPDISITDVDGDVISSPYVPAIYFDGIDYDGADDADWPYFKIDGKVSNVPLDSYVPFFLDYLPYGSTISRYAYDQDLSSWYWTDEADANSDPSVLAQLATDYTVFPDTLQEPAEGEEVKIKFRVTAEDGLTQVFYYITVTDITYNLSIVFDIYYCTDATQGSCVLAENSVDFNDELVIITVQNLDTGLEADQIGGNIPDNFPSFDTVLGLNNQMTQFYYTFATSYEYKFGRNTAGFYNFNVTLPLDQYLNDLYTYEIEFGDYNLNDSSDYVSTLDGKYFYIEYATTNRTRRFNIYIRSITSPETGAPFGLFDFFESWSED